MSWDQAGKQWFKPQKRDGWYQNYRGLQKFLHRCQQWGIEVFQVPNQECLANLIVDLYWDSQVPFEEHKTFQRVVREKLVMMGDYRKEPRKLRLMKQLMGLEAGIGEEIAEAIARVSQNLEEVFYFLRQPEGSRMWIDLRTVKLRNEKRTVGPAAVQRLREAIGI